MSVLLKNLTSDELWRELASAGISLRQARMIQATVMRTGALPGSRHGLSEKVLQLVRSAVTLPSLTLLQQSSSRHDGFTKYVFRGDGATPFEAVRIPLLHRSHDPKFIACISSQVGCAMGCAFCFTGRMGFHRNLAPWEMVDQVMRIQADSPHPVRGVVFMGMGEPMLNYEAVIQAARILSEPCGMAISGKAITISTAGIVPGIRRFTAEGHPYRLVVSLSGADPGRRRELMPIESSYPLPALMEVLRERVQANGQRITLAWTMVSGVNTREKDARDLAALTQGLPVKIDLIDVNDPTGRYQPPSEAELNAFRDALRKHLSAPVARRYSGGKDIGAACGLLGAHGSYVDTHSQKS